jgi:hypothetical protein
LVYFVLGRAALLRRPDVWADQQVSPTDLFHPVTGTLT